MEIIIPLAAAVLITSFIAYLRRGRSKITCPQCSGEQVRLVEQQLKELKQENTVGYAVKLDVQLIMKSDYRCSTCNHSWSVTAPEN